MNTRIINFESLPTEVKAHATTRINQIFQPNPTTNPLDPITTTTGDNRYRVELTTTNDRTHQTHIMHLTYWQVAGDWGCTETTYEAKNTIRNHGFI